MKFAATVPIRADLATVPPIYYPIVELIKFNGVAAMCRHCGWERRDIDDYVTAARINMSNVVVCPRLVLGDPRDKVVAVLIFQPSGAVTLCCGMFADAGEDRGAVEKEAEVLAAHPEMQGKRVFIGEFRPNPLSTLQPPSTLQ